MLMIHGAASLLLWLVIVPVFVGVLPASLVEPSKKRISTIFLCGWLLTVAIFQLIGSIFVMALRSLTELISVYIIVMVILSVAGAIITILGIVRKGLSEFIYIPSLRKINKTDYVTWGVFVIFLIIQMIYCIRLAMPNGDDSYYLAIANIADKLDGMYVLSAYTGFTEEFNLRHALSLFPMFYAFLARQSGLHVAIIAHVIMQPFMICIMYMIFYRIGLALFDDKKSNVPVFMVLMAGIQMFGASSIYTNEVFALTRTWQGKAILAGMAIPATFSILYNISKVSSRNQNGLDIRFLGYYILLALVNIFGGFASSLGLILLCIYECVVLLIIAIRNKRSLVLIAGIGAMIPNVIYMLFYVFS